MTQSKPKCSQNDHAKGCQFQHDRYRSLGVSIRNAPRPRRQHNERHRKGHADPTAAALTKHKFPRVARRHRNSEKRLHNIVC